MAVLAAGPFYRLDFTTTAERLAYAVVADLVGRTSARDFEDGQIYEVIAAGSGSQCFAVASGSFVSTAAGTTNALTAKATVVDADVIAIEDSAAGFVRKKTLFSTILTYIAAGFVAVDRAFAGNLSVGAGDGSKKLSFFSTGYFINSVTGLNFGSSDNFTFTNALGLVFKLFSTGRMQVYGTVITAGTTGAQTINKPSGSVNFAASASSLVVTNSLVTTTSLVHCQIQTADATATFVKSVVCAAGSFTITLNAAATAETRVSFLVLETA